jgi:CRISPR type III-associated protein (TIGR04423 family)
MGKKTCYILTDSLDNYLEKEFTGYCWMSDESLPCLIDGKFTLPAIGANPFVVEANLYSKDEKISVSIEHNDGRYLIGIVNWDEAAKDTSIILEEQKYLTHRLTDNNFKKIIMVRAWVPVMDPLCENMEVLQPAWRAFKGFKKLSTKSENLDKNEIY